MPLSGPVRVKDDQENLGLLRGQGRPHEDRLLLGALSTLQDFAVSQCANTLMEETKTKNKTCP